MQATTSGEIHKKEVYLGNKNLKNVFEKQKNIFLEFIEKSNVLYGNKVSITDPALNYLNMIPEDSIEECLNNIILKEYYECEKIYPYLGDYMLHKLFNASKVKTGKRRIMFSKKEQNVFIKYLRSPVAKNIAEWLFKNTNLNRSINIEKYHGNSLLVESLKEFNFNIDYEYIFYNKTPIEDVKNYRFVIINGVIETVGEIHHLFFKANKTKEPYVIFCFGMSEEVKQTILKNNTMGRFKVYPVCLSVNDENALNILNDIAAIHNTSVVSSDLGQTISQEVSKDLPFGKKISFAKKNISINPVASNKQIEVHRTFLRKRIEEAQTKPDVRSDILKNRLKMFTGSRINFYIPNNLMRNTNQIREIDYFFRFVSSLRLKMKIVSLSGQKFYIPEDYINIVETKKKSLLDKIYNIQAIIV